LFNKELGVKFITLLTQHRVEQAKQLLKDGKLKIYAISQMVGYNDVGYFCKVFKKYTGMSPGDFEHSPE
jgi:YesN/AraC family two-component response regulator